MRAVVTRAQWLAPECSPSTIGLEIHLKPESDEDWKILKGIKDLPEGKGIGEISSLVLDDDGAEMELELSF